MHGLSLCFTQSLLHFLHQLTGPDQLNNSSASLTWPESIFTNLLLVFLLLESVCFSAFLSYSPLSRSFQLSTTACVLRHLSLRFSCPQFVHKREGAMPRRMRKQDNSPTNFRTDFLYACAIHWQIFFVLAWQIFFSQKGGCMTSLPKPFFCCNFE